MFCMVLRLHGRIFYWYMFIRFQSFYSVLFCIFYASCFDITQHRYIWSLACSIIRITIFRQYCRKYGDGDFGIAWISNDSSYVIVLYFLPTDPIVNLTFDRLKVNASSVEITSLLRCVGNCKSFCPYKVNY